MPGKPEKLLTIRKVSQMAKDAGVSIHDASLNRMVLQGKIPGATTERPGPRGGFARHLIPEPQARKIVGNLKLRQKLLETHVTVDDVVKQARGLREILPHGEERELRLKVNDIFVQRLIKSKKVKGAIRDPASPILKTWLIPEDQVNEILFRVLQLNAPRISGHLRIEDVVKTARRQGASTSVTAITNRLRNPRYATLLGAARYIGQGKKPNWLVSKDGARRIIACAKVGTWNFMRDTRDLTVDEVESQAKSVVEATRSGAYLTAARAARELKISLPILYRRKGVPWETYAGRKYLKSDAVRALKVAIGIEKLKRIRHRKK